MKTHRLIINNQQVTYYTADTFSNDRPVVFLHGWCSNGLVFQPLFESAGNWLSIDWPGFGASELPRDDWFLDNYVDTLHTLLQSLQITNPVLVGHSFGGSVIIRYCATHPNVYPVVLVGSAGIRTKKLSVLLKKNIAHTVKRGSLVLPKFLQHKISQFGRRLASDDYRNAGALKQTMTNILAQDLQADLPAVGNRVTLLWGENDQDTPVADGQRMQKLLPSAELHIIPGASHYCFLDNTTVFLDYFTSAIR